MIRGILTCGIVLNDSFLKYGWKITVNCQKTDVIAVSKEVLVKESKTKSKLMKTESEKEIGNKIFNRLPKKNKGTKYSQYTSKPTVFAAKIT